VEYSTDSVFAHVWVLAISVLVVLQIWPFFAGYHLTADDNFFHFIVLDSNPVHAIINVARQIAEDQGRIGQYLAVPLLGAGNYFIDEPWFRVIVVGTFVAVVALVALYLRELAEPGIGALFFVVFFCAVPLEHHHLPPNSFPLYLTLQLAVILGLRIVLLHLRQGHTRLRIVELAIQPLLIVISLSALEYGLIVVSYLIALEILAFRWRVFVAIARQGGRPGAGVAAGLIHALSAKTVIIDLLVIVLVLFVHLAYRAAHPSGYDGNSLAGTLNPGALSWTALLHIASGISLSLVRDVIFDAPAWRWGAAGICAIAAGLAVYMLLKRRQASQTWLGLMVFGVAFAVLTVLPVAATLKYQEWCVVHGECLYVDSRIAYFGIVTALVGLFIGIYHRAAQHAYRPVVVGLLGTAAGAAAGVTFLHNSLVAERMRATVEPWLMAQRYACLYPEPNTQQDMPLVESAEFSNILWHPFLKESRADYWHAYLSHLRKDKGRCSESPGLRPNQPLEFGLPAAADQIYLRGWWEPEGWGRWSASKHPLIAFRMVVGKEATHAAISAWAYTPSTRKEQIVDVSVNGEFTCRLRLGQIREHILIPLSRTGQSPEGMTEIAFDVHNPISPSAVEGSKDTRDLGLAIATITLLGGHQVGNWTGQHCRP
jgi:hypothetical protein